MIAEYSNVDNKLTTNIMKKMFAGVSEEQLQVTIKTIIQIENNLKMI